MKNYRTLALTCILILLGGIAQAAPYDTFSGSLMDRSKWKNLEAGTRIVDNKLELTFRPAKGHSRNPEPRFENPAHQCLERRNRQ